MMQPDQCLCWQCGAPLEGLILPMSRREECGSCGADQHVCRLCAHYDSNISDQCREDRAEQVKDKERANFCDYFEPRFGAYQGRVAAQGRAREELARLFGEAAPESQQNTSLSTEQAEEEWRKLFGD